MSSTEPQAPTPAKPPRDWWDKAEIVSKFLSSVVIALVGILISYSIQRAQLIATQRTSEAQISVAAAKAESDRKIQEAQLAAQLVNHLISKNDAQREIAIVALRASLPPSTFDRIIAVVARNESDPELRSLAIRQLGWSSSETATTALRDIVNDTGRPATDRAQAERSVLQIATTKTVATVAPRGNVLLASTGATGDAIDAAPTGYSPFATSIISGIQGPADENEDSLVSGAELAHHVATAVPAATPWQQPIWVRKGRSDVILGPPQLVAQHYRRMRAVLVGVSTTPSVGHRLIGPNNDVRAVAGVLRRAQMETMVLLNDQANRSAVLAALRAVANSSTEDDLFIYYFSGFGQLTPSAEVQWLLTSGERISATELKNELDKIPAGNKAVFINSSYAGGITR